MDKSKINKIEYQCNQCQVSRLLLFPKSLSLEFDSRGLVDIIDVHDCQNKKKNGILLNVDPQLNVRSQIPINKKIAESEEDSLGIPMPKKVEYAIVTIDSDYRNRTKNILKLRIKDKMRQTIYRLEGTHKQEKTDIEVKSNLGFITINASLTKKIDNKSGKKWLKELANVIEKAAYVRDSDYSILMQFLDTQITEPLDNKQSELSILLESSIAFPFASKENLNDFEKSWSQAFPEITMPEYTDYKRVMKLCLRNETNTVATICTSCFDDFNMGLADIVRIMAQLINHNFLTLYRLEFIAKN